MTNVMTAAKLSRLLAKHPDELVFIERDGHVFYINVEVGRTSLGSAVKLSAGTFAGDSR